MLLRAAPHGALLGAVPLPGDKSVSHRSLMLAALAVGENQISGLLEGEDVLATAHALRALGVELERAGPGSWRVWGVGVGGLAEPAEVLDMGNAGTGARLLMGLLAGHGFTSFVTGDASLRSRPMRRVIEPLSRMGVSFLARSGGRLPLALTGRTDLLPIVYESPVASAQVKSAVLLAGLHAPGSTTVVEPLASRDHTERMLAAMGAEVVVEVTPAGGRRVTITGQPELKAQSFVVPGDPSSAGFPAVAAAVARGSAVRLLGVALNPLRTGLYTCLGEMGADIAIENESVAGGEPIGDLVIRGSALIGIDVPAARAPSMIDEYPILAVAAAFADGTTVMRGLGELRVKESDRLELMAAGLAACGVSVEVSGDDLVVHGRARPAGGQEIDARLDHRIAMSFLVLGGLAAAPVTVAGAEAIETSFPGFAALMNGLGAHITPLESGTVTLPMVIAVDGPAASGKSTLARRLAAEFRLEFLDTGLLYRAVARTMIDRGLDPGDSAAAVRTAQALAPEDVDPGRLRGEGVGQNASRVAAVPDVRAALLPFQRRFAARPPGAVLAGRDVGTVICPDATFKLFVTASDTERARRRFEELRGRGDEPIYAAVLEELQERDHRDAERMAAPMRIAPDAWVLDTTSLDAQSAFTEARAYIEAGVAAAGRPAVI